MQDLDLLVRHHDIDQACALLERAGLRRRPPSRPARAAPAYYERAYLLGDVIVEVHQFFLQRSRHPVDYAAVWDRRQPDPAVGPQAARLSPADALAYHALSIGKDEFTVPAIRYVDLWLMVRAWPEALPAAAALSRQWRCGRAFFGALHQAARLFPELAGDPLARAREVVGPLARRLLPRLVLPPASEQGRPGAVTRRRQLWRKFWLMDGARPRLGLLAEQAASAWRGRRRGPR
jgi:hypothetical protein